MEYLDYLPDIFQDTLEFRRFGQWIWPTVVNVREGIAAVSRWLAEGKLSFDPGCEQCIREFSLYRWEDGGSERPVKEQDHAMDDLRYFVMYCEQEEKPGGFCAARVERTRR